MKSSESASRGLATLALLKANFDEGHDHIGMFQPFLIDAISNLDKDDFKVEQIKDAMLSRHGLAVPIHTLRTLLVRTSKGGLVRREYRRYFRVHEFPPSNIPEAKAKIEAEHSHLTAELRNYLADHHQPLETDEDALALLLEFLKRNHIGMVLDESHQDQPDSGDSPSHRKTRLLVRFVKEVIPSNDRLTAILHRMLEGFILQNALVLKDIGSAKRKFKDLCVFLDTRLVLQALGYQGEASRVATTEMIAMLKRTGARVAVFEPTIKEIKSLLYFYQYRVGTSQGRNSLNDNPLTRFMLTHHCTPSDVAQIIALLDQSVLDAGLSIRPVPKRSPRYTRDEEDLAGRLAKTDAPEDEPRVWHDVDCVAAVLTLRGSAFPQDIDNAKAIFVSATGLVIKNVTEWFHQQIEGEHFKGKAEHLIPPIVHHIALSNAAWLKFPASGQKLKLHELISLCSAALQPTRKTWDQFKRHLRKLQDSGVVSSDETAAILANQLTDVHLSHAEDHLTDDTDIDSDSLNDVIERVRASYTAAAQEHVAKAKHATEQQRNLQLRVHQKADNLASTITKGALWVLALVVIALLVDSLFEFSGLALQIAHLLLLVVNVLSLLFGFFVFKYRDRLQAWLASRIRRWLTGTTQL